MKFVKSVLAIAFVFTLAGCGSVASFRPLYQANEKPAANPLVEGDWVSTSLQNGDETKNGADQWKVTVQPDGCYLAHEDKKSTGNNKSDEQETYSVCLVPLGAKLYYDAQLLEKRVGTQIIKTDDMQPGMTRVHFVGQVEAQQDFVRLAPLSTGWLNDHVQEEMRDRGIFTGSTQTLRSLLTQQVGDKNMFPSGWYLCRPNSDCGQRVVQDELSRSPKDPAILSTAAMFLIQRGKCREALALLDQRAELEPGDAAGREESGWARLCLRDFQGARSDFAASAKLDPKQTDEPLVGVAYFLEGNYAEAYKMFAKWQSSDSDAAAWGIVLTYVSLARSGQAKQAESFLAEQMSRFVGSEEDQLLLLRATGRVKGYSPQFTDDEVEEGRAVLYALLRSTQGDRDGARQALEQTLQKLGEYHPLSIGARIELERLAPSRASAKP